MFTKKTITLSTVVSDRADLGADLEIVRDFAFAYVGKLPSRLDRRLVSVSSERHLQELENAEGVEGVIATPEVAAKIPNHFGLAICSDPYARIMDIHEYLIEIPEFQWANFPSQIDASAKIHPSAVVAENNVKIAEGCVIGPNAVICERTIIGANSSIGPGTVVGCEAYDMKPGPGPQRLLKQSGGVLIGKDVVILSSTTIVRATFGGFTVIEDEAAIDNLVHLAHDCHVGRRAKIVACATVCGRVVIGEGSYIGPNATVSNGITLGERSTVTLGAVTVKDVAEDSRVTGNFALPHTKWINFIKSIR
ncbi:hypothetical protein ACFOWX_08665 [Sphingorhabdus arenilitoris]|uniref:UDP-3-O-(3-hydroxymyristoyl)glucosamine N-acyltransferase n=1 Tax=Sphingorhabdus arenilitoris TaxID=1490041 RepID=A0ABV8RIH1_9SPHN